MQRTLKLTLAIAAFLVLLAGTAFAQEGQVAGTVRDSSDAVMPGVLVEVRSPALIEKVRSATTDGNRQYRRRQEALTGSPSRHNARYETSAAPSFPPAPAATAP